MKKSRKIGKSIAVGTCVMSAAALSAAAHALLNENIM